MFREGANHEGTSRFTFRCILHWHDERRTARDTRTEKHDGKKEERLKKEKSNDHHYAPVKLRGLLDENLLPSKQCRVEENMYRREMNQPKNKSPDQEWKLHSQLEDIAMRNRYEKLARNRDRLLGIIGMASTVCRLFRFIKLPTSSSALWLFADNTLFRSFKKFFIFQFLLKQNIDVFGSSIIHPSAKLTVGGFRKWRASFVLCKSLKWFWLSRWLEGNSNVSGAAAKILLARRELIVKN